MFDSVSMGGGMSTAAGFFGSGIRKDYQGAAATAQKSGTSEASNTPAQEDVNRIKEIGFGKWVEELREKKLEEMRQEILAAMGLTEEDLGKMDPDARASIEEMIAQEIQERLAAGSVEVGKKASGQSLNPAQSANAAGAFSTDMGKMGQSANIAAVGPTAMTVLLQEQEKNSANATGKADPDEAGDDARRQPGILRDPDDSNTPFYL
ncbi:hypothetical protein HH303_09795 [Rhodospirillaceae bacterium KN72]|uniref:Uncharacterized protein n=1 Tax=Pacificispira spongiicola TaxID=2729598 RepID=A0A7Y0E033_9PROT|nr:hypothetical protein [Pacificispira spongiicola]NMM44770.1 hypothetical protein [Pacificispira spongiicola]